MAEPTKPGQGVIVRADFGGGIDQSADAWKVPPNQLSELVNGRLEKVGSIRKRTGYQTATEPKTASGLLEGEPGEPINAAASSIQTLVIDRARQLPLNPSAGTLTDRWEHVYPTVLQDIAQESGYVARNYSPTTVGANGNNGWTTTGPASDVIGDVRILDGNAGNIDECVDYVARENWIFVVKCNKAVNENSTGQVTVSMYDATTGVLISENRQTFGRARVYPKIISPTANWLLVAVADYSQSGTATPYTGTVDLLTYSYANSGLTFSGVEPTDAIRNGIDYFPIQLFQGVPEQKFRPAVPFDLIDIGSSNFIFAAYRTGQGLRTARYNFTAPGVTLTANVTHTAGIGANPIQALSLGRATGFFILSAFSAPFTAGAFPPYNAADYDLHVGRFNYTTCALIDYAVRFILRQAGATPFPGRLTVYQRVEDTASNGDTVGLVEVYEASGAGYQTAAHTLFVVHGLGTALTVERRSYAIPAARAFPLTYFPYVKVDPFGGELTMQGRIPLIVGTSQQSVYGLNTALPTQPPTTNFAGNYSATIGTQILCGISQLAVSCVNSPFQTYAPKLQPCPPPKTFEFDDRGVTKIAVPHLVAIDGANGFAIGIIVLQRRSAGDVQPSSFADLPIIPGGVVQQSDGERFAEVALVDRPVIHQIIASNAGTAWQMTPGDYLVQAIAVYRDSNGNMHRSTPSDPFRWVQAAAPNTGCTLSITFSYQSYTNRNDVQIEFYCTEPNGTVLRYWFSAQNIIGDSNVATIHDPSFSTTAPQLGAIGLPALDAPTLYTTGGVLPNVPIPSARFATLYKNRMIVGGSDDPKSVYYSNGPQAYQAASFAVGNVIRMEHEGGCTAAGALNDKLILFSANGIYATFGQFRDSTGAGDALAELESIHDYIGCTQPISVVSIPVGLLFFATDGRFYMIDERLGLNPVGLRVQELTQGGMDTVRAAVHIEAEREVRFYMANQGASTACVLVYNYQIDQWSRDVVQASVGVLPGTQATINDWGGACMSRDFRSFVVTDARWIYDDGSSYYDDTYWIRLEAKTAWIQPGGTQDYSRFRNAQFLGRSAASHNLTIRAFCDFDETTVRATGTWTAAQLAPIANTVWPEQVRLQVGTQKTQAVKIQIYDDPPTGATTGQGPQLIGLALEVLPLGGMRRLPAVRKA